MTTRSQIDWTRIGALRHNMTGVQAVAVAEFIGDRRPSIVAVHDCGIASVELDHVSYFDETGTKIHKSTADRRMKEWKPKRGRPKRRS